MKFGTVYFNHPRERENCGPRLTHELGATCVQLDFAEVSWWYQVHKGEGLFDWNRLDKGYAECEKYGIDSVPSLSQHFSPPEWLGVGPYDEQTVETPQYAGLFGDRFSKMTLVQKAFADYVTALVEKYGDRTKSYVMSHEWNFGWTFCTKMGSPQYDAMIRNQTACTLLAYKIIKRQNADAKLSYGLYTTYRTKTPDGEPVTPLIDSLERYPFSPSFMIRMYQKTRDRDFLDLIKTTYFFYLSHSDSPDEYTPTYSDTRAGDAVEAFYRNEVVIDEKTYRYRDYVDEIIVNPQTMHGPPWLGNTKRGYAEEEQGVLIEGTTKNIMEARDRGVPVSTVLYILDDKNKYYGTYSYGQWTYVPEGIYKMSYQPDPMRRGPTTWDISYVPTKAVDYVKRVIARYS